jgi:hypothetical protein
VVVVGKCGCEGRNWGKMNNDVGRRQCGNMCLFIASELGFW